MIPFNKPYCTGDEIEYIREVCNSMTMSGNGKFTKQCQSFFEKKYGFKKCLLTTSGTDALEMCAMLCNIEPGDEVIVPSYTFVSSALAFVREGAKIILADSSNSSPNIDAEHIEPLITPKTKVIVVVHYAGVACNMDEIMALAEKNNLLVVEDAAHAIDSYFKGRALGSIGHLAAFSFHETKNINSGEGGMLVVNDERFIHRSEIIWEKGTNRADFYRGMVNKYGWCDVGSSFLPSEITAAFLWAQLQHMDDIQKKRLHIWTEYDKALSALTQDTFKPPVLPSHSTNNAHMYYLTLNSLADRTAFISHLANNDIQATFHYIPLHSSTYFVGKHDGRAMPNCDRFSDTLVRLPLFYELSDEQIKHITNAITSYCTQ